MRLCVGCKKRDANVAEKRKEVSSFEFFSSLGCHLGWRDRICFLYTNLSPGPFTTVGLKHVLLETASTFQGANRSKKKLKVSEKNFQKHDLKRIGTSKCECIEVSNKKQNKGCKVFRTRNKIGNVLESILLPFCCKKQATRCTCSWSDPKSLLEVYYILNTKKIMNVFSKLPSITQDAFEHKVPSFI